MGQPEALAASTEVKMNNIKYKTNIEAWNLIKDVVEWADSSFRFNSDKFLALCQIFDFFLELKPLIDELRIKNDWDGMKK